MLVRSPRPHLPRAFDESCEILATENLARENKNPDKRNYISDMKQILRNQRNTILEFKKPCVYERVRGTGATAITQDGRPKDQISYSTQLSGLASRAELCLEIFLGWSTESCFFLCLMTNNKQKSKKCCDKGFYGFFCCGSNICCSLLLCIVGLMVVLNLLYNLLSFSDGPPGLNAALLLRIDLFLM